jgi:hypothetical protein
MHGPERILVASMGIRPIGVSRYCLGTALLHPELAANRWNRERRRHFGWRRELDPSSNPA